MLEGLTFCIETMNLEYESACKNATPKIPYYKVYFNKYAMCFQKNSVVEYF